MKISDRRYLSYKNAKLDACCRYPRRGQTFIRQQLSKTESLNSHFHRKGGIFSKYSNK